MTNSLKYTFGALLVLIGIYFYNQNVQQSYTVPDSSIFSGNPEDIHRVLISEGDNVLEFVYIFR